MTLLGGGEGFGEGPQAGDSPSSAIQSPGHGPGRCHPWSGQQNGGTSDRPWRAALEGSILEAVTGHFIGRNVVTRLQLAAKEACSLPTKFPLTFLKILLPQ